MSPRLLLWATRPPCGPVFTVSIGSQLHKYLHDVIPRSDLPRNYTVHVFCPMCRDIFTPRSSRSASIDGAYFGTTFPHLFLMTFPELIPQHGVQSFVVNQGLCDAVLNARSVLRATCRFPVFLDSGSIKLALIILSNLYM